ncbi:hypothetical protein LCGC14_1449760 [marine sediment metagenome]|uniref:YD repeat-containing protein n=2 Tax=root TaxID=1 RepID=A0A831VSG5_9FLAO|nr:hypothetical protein [Pricia antarctica]
MFRQCIFLFLILLLGLPYVLASQAIKTFKIEDFGLKGNVKSCLVITDYGKEEYHFDTIGRLTKSITRFNDFDYETTYYKFQNNELIEKRVENYFDNTFDKSTSIANFYKFDSLTNRKVTEKIVSYTKQLLEQNVYSYNEEGQLINLTRTDTDGTDETLIAYDTIDGKQIMTQTINGRPLEVVKTWNEAAADGSENLLKSTIKYFDAKLNTKSVEMFNTSQMLVSRNDFLYDGSTEKWIPQEAIIYSYDNGILSKKTTQKQNLTVTKNYIYQFDGTTFNNWVKEIITPDNTYKTRKINYYPLPETMEQ